MADEAEAPKKHRKKDAAEIFAVDRRAWAYVCSLGFDVATAYIIMASGTGHDQSTTWWSATAVEKWAGMSWYLANEAIALLKEKGALREVARRGSLRRYKLSAAHEIPGVTVPDPSLTTNERAVIEYIQRHGGKTSLATTKSVGLPGLRNPHSIGCNLVERGLLRRALPYGFEIVGAHYLRAEPEPDWIWLPNAIVVGVGDEPPPIKRLRRAQNPLAMRLFIDLYHAHGLTRHGGIEWSYPHGIMSTFNRFRIGERGLFTIWGFTPKVSATSWVGSRLLSPHGAEKVDTEGSKAFWDAFELLRRLGLVEMVPHLVANEVGPKTPEPDIIHPAPVETGTEEERAITVAAARAARAMLHPSQWKFACERRNAPIVPVPMEYEQVQLIGIPRMVYRPRTTATKRWFADGSEVWAEKVAEFVEMAAAANDPVSGQALRRDQG